MKYFLLAMFFLPIFWLLIRKPSTIDAEHANANFFNNATNFYQKNKISSVVYHPNESENKINHDSLSLQKIRMIEKDINDLYDVTPNELIKNAPLLLEKQKELQLMLAINDQKVDPALLIEPFFRIVLATYLEIAPENLTERQWIDGAIPTKTWKKLLNISRSNDFRVLLLNNKLSKEELDQFLEVPIKK